MAVFASRVAAIPQKTAFTITISEPVGTTGGYSYIVVNGTTYMDTTAAGTVIEAAAGTTVYCHIKDDAVTINGTVVLYGNGSWVAYEYTLAGNISIEMGWGGISITEL